MESQRVPKGSKEDIQAVKESMKATKKLLGRGDLYTHSTIKPQVAIKPEPKDDDQRQSLSMVEAARRQVNAESQGVSSASSGAVVGGGKTKNKRVATEQTEPADFDLPPAREDTEDREFLPSTRQAVPASTRPNNPFAGLKQSGPRLKRQDPTAHTAAQTAAQAKARAFAPPAKKRNKTGPYTGKSKLIDPETYKDFTRSDVDFVNNVVRLIKLIEEGDGDVSEPLQYLTQFIHMMEFCDNLCYGLLNDAGLLKNKGLLAVMNNHNGGFPVDLKDDCKVLFTRFSKKDCGNELLRGIQLKSRDKKKQTNSGLEDMSYYTKSLEPDYKHRKNAHIFGNNELVNGQWWPLRICMVRDGAHGEHEAGISGSKTEGAFSVVLSDAGYHNIDNGTTVEYCGTPGKDGKESANTKLMMKTHQTGKSIRVFRSAGKRNNAQTTYLPVAGHRYDGLYRVTGDQVVDAASAMHRFTLERRNGQSAIRWAGEVARPTANELANWAGIQKKLKPES